MFIIEILKFFFGKLNLLLGMKNIFLKRSFVDLGKNLIVVIIVLVIVYKYMKFNY